MILSRVPIKNTHLTVASRTISISVSIIPAHHEKLKIIHSDQDNLTIEFGKGAGFNKFIIKKTRCYCTYAKDIYNNIIGDWKMVSAEDNIIKFCRIK